MNEEIKQKSFLTSKELWLLFGGLINTVLGKFGLPSIAWTPETISAFIVIIGVIRTFWTETKLTL